MAENSYRKNYFHYLQYYIRRFVVYRNLHSEYTGIRETKVRFIDYMLCLFISVHFSTKINIIDANVH